MHVPRDLPSDLPCGALRGSASHTRRGSGAVQSSNRVTELVQGQLRPQHCWGSST